jgi:hypothetical protein
MANGRGLCEFDRAQDTHQLVIDAVRRRDAGGAAAAIVKDIIDETNWYRSRNGTFFPRRQSGLMFSKSL